jgi:hypothetical protein
MPTDEEYEVQMILTYVPEAEYLPWETALFTAHVRDAEAARQLEWIL